MSATARLLIGREDELGVIEALLDARELLPSVSLLHGEAGIGKTSLWLGGTEVAVEGGYQVLSCRPSEAETRLSYAGLTDLLGGVVDNVLPELPPLQQRALEAALLLGETEAGIDERAVAAAFLGATRRLATDGPLCVAVDDVQWLDPATLTVLRYALARLDDAPVAALLAARGAPPAWLRSAPLEERLTAIEISGLSIGATSELLHTRLGARFPRPTLIRLWETAGGNPLFALELARALHRRGGRLALGEELPIPSDLHELLRARLDGLSAEALDVARAVAALADPTVTLVEAAAGAGFDRGLGEALGAGILELDGERVRLTHPLMGPAVGARLTPAHRRSLNARLAEIAPSAEERARHLALATAEPDDHVAAILDDAARTALARGAPTTAAELAEQSLRLTPASSPDDALRRLLSAAAMHSRAGDDDQAIALLESARSAAAPGNERATVVAQLAGIEPHLAAAAALFREALAESDGDDALRATIHLNLAALMRFSDGVESGIEHGRLAVDAASRVDDAGLLCRALAAHSLLRFNGGRGGPDGTIEEAFSLERRLPEWPLDGGPTSVLGHQLWWSGDVGRARVLFGEARSAVTARNDPTAIEETLWYLSLLEWRAGNWEESDRYAAESYDLVTQLGRVMTPVDEFPTAIVAAHRGRIDDARTRAQRAVSLAEAEGILVAVSGHSWVLGFVELSLGDPAAALEHLGRAYELRADILEPGMRVELGDLLEALIATGELDEAERVLREWEPRAATLDRAWGLAILARCRGLLLAARGDLGGAFASFEHALAEHDRDVDPFSRARTLLALGRTQRRAKKRAAARITLQDALNRFETLGAPLWAEQTRTELARIGGRAPSRNDLTQAERRIANLVAEGHTNKQVAAALFLTEHSVETALTRIYRKLDVRSRTELARALSKT